MPRFPTEGYSKELARRLRRSMTEEELRLWWYLRDQTPYKWRRQEPVGRFIADFLCYEARVIVEVDGLQHGGVYDTARDDWLSRRGFAVLRFGNEEITHEIGSVLDAIALTCQARGPNHRRK